MANNKKSFILYCDLIHTIEHLSDEQAGNLFKHILNYVNDRNPITDNVITNLAFEPIKQQLKRDLKDWEDKLEQRSVAGLNSAISKFLIKLDLSTKEEIKAIKIDTEIRLKENKDNEYLQQVLILCNERLTKSTTVESRSTKSTVNDTVTVTVTDINSSEIETQTDYDKFLKWFNTTRTKYLEVPSHINRLTQIDKSNLEILKKSYSNDEFNIALLNLCNDKWANESNLILPNHFLKEENFVKYLNMPQRKLLTKREKQIAGWGV